MKDPEDWGTIPTYLKKDTPLGGTPEYPGFVFRYNPYFIVGEIKMIPDSEGKYFDESLLNFHKDVVAGLRTHIAKLDDHIKNLEESVAEITDGSIFLQKKIKELEDWKHNQLYEGQEDG